MNYPGGEKETGSLSSSHTPPLADAQLYSALPRTEGATCRGGLDPIGLERVADPDDLTSVLAHELEAPLLSLELRLRRALSELGASETIASCLVEVSALRTLVHDFLALEPRNVRIRTFSLDPIFEAVARTFGPIAIAKNVALDLPSSAGEALGDPGATTRIVSNLVDNALKFAPASTRVRLRARPLDDAVAIDVEDEGPGIPDASRGRIFEPFFRLDRERSGAGLGLAIARSLARAQKATISVTSASPKGSCFTLTLPRK
jgi:signal transduction histidine kinase